MKKPNVLWVTSYTGRLYEASGRRLVESFSLLGIEGELLVTYEDMGNIETPSGPGLWSYSLDRSEGLREWLAEYSRIIPTDLGGSWTGPCGCPSPLDPHAKNHKLPCPGYWFCRHASRWVRKIFALEQAVQIAKANGHEAIIWLDADCAFTAKVTADKALSWFNGRSIFYLQGRKRVAPENGVMGFRNGDGFDFLYRFRKRFTQGTFEHDVRWDDCHQLRMCLKDNPAVSRIDLATTTTGHADVLPGSPIGKFIVHHKGSHGRILQIFT